MGIIASELHNDLEVLKRYANEKHKIQFRKPSDYIPGEKHRKEKITGRRIGVALRRMYG